MIFPVMINNLESFKPPSYIIDFDKLKQDTSLYLTSSEKWERDFGKMIYESGSLGQLIHQMKSTVSDCTTGEYIPDHNLNITILYNFLYREFQKHLESQDYLVGERVDVAITLIKASMDQCCQYYSSIGLINYYQTSYNNFLEEIWIHIEVNGRFLPSFNFSFS